MSNSGAAVQGKAATNSVPQLPADLAAVALVDARTAAAAGGMGTSWWYARMRDGTAPQPVVRAPRCTRWRAADVADFWRDFAAKQGGR